MTRPVEISFTVEMHAGITLHIDPGAVLTAAMIDEAIAAINQTLHDGAVQGGGASLYASIHRRDGSLPIEAFHPEANGEWHVEAGHAITLPEGPQA